MSDQTTAAPSTRVSEAELLYLEKHFGMPADPHQALRVVAEIRRYRALLLGLALAWHGPHDDVPETCPFHMATEPRCPEACPWPELRAEVQAIRAERRQP